jgi:hypothetical protein
MEDTVHNEALGRNTYEMDREDLLGEVNVLLTLMAEISARLDEGDVEAAQWILHIKWECDAGHCGEPEERLLECPVCQAPETKRMMAKWDAQAKERAIRAQQ